jgi:bifunctional non-homologous end joining protein LigD
MPLEEYARKRTFSKTPEPPPSSPEPAGGNRFFVQRHHARRLHYDFRLEIGGTLKSWAVPNGPTLDPAKKNLAVMVEDHPLDYGNFEGNIPKGNYGAGSVMLWDRGSFELLGEDDADAQLARGDLKFRLQGEKLKGAFALVRMKNRGKGNEWLILKKKDEAAQPGWDLEALAYSILTGRTQEEIARDMPARESPKSAARDLSKVVGAVKAPFPTTLPVMQAFPVDSPPSGAGWLYEIKWDGVRALCYIENGAIRLVSRRGLKMDRQYPELSPLHHQIQAQSAILDGEIAALDDQGRPSFALIQPRIMVTGTNTVAQLARSRPVTLFLFDLLYLDGYDLRRVPLIERKRILKEVLQPNETFRYSDHFEGHGDSLLAAARAQGLEGVMAKRANSLYVGKRSPDWLKIKLTQQQEFVICGFTAGEREYFGSLALGYYERGKMQFAGCVGTGFDRKLLEGVYSRLEPLITSKPTIERMPAIPQKVTWVRPELVSEVKFSNWTEDGRLRAPVFLGLRPDVDPKDCVREIGGQAARGALIPEDKTELTLDVDGRRIKFTHVNKIMYPAEGYAKRDILNYYDAVAPLLLPHLESRPLSLKRYPNGIEQGFFFQKETEGKGFPAWMRTTPIVEDGAAKQYAVGGDRAGLLYLANLGCIDQNPWMSRVGSLENPDFILIDLDPQECSFDLIVEAAILVRNKLDALGLEAYPKTTGGDGMHLYIPIEPVYSYDQARTFAEIIARIVATERPELFTTPRAVSKRQKGKVYFDYLQIGKGKTISAPYVLRAHPGAPVATPLDWNEVKPGLDPHQFHIGNVLDRFERTGDVFEGVLKKPQRLEPAMARLETLVRR